MQTPPSLSPPLDGHVHSEWSWDADNGSMAATCRRALELGLQVVAFTDHADFTEWVSASRAQELRAAGGLPLGLRPVGRHRDDGELDIAGYWDCIDRCRAEFPQLRILSGVELGEAHHFPAQAAALLGFRPLDRVLGSAHCIPLEGGLIDCSGPGVMGAETAALRMRSYLTETLALVEADPAFSVLAHLDYPKRYWPHDRLPFAEADYEAEYRAVLSALAGAGRALEVNTSRGIDPQRGLCPGPTVLRWWREEGGQALFFGSDAHDPAGLMRGFEVALEAAEAAGFRRGRDPLDAWRP
ncbi:MAG: PHP domain-containing protein [Candidatus Dormibacteria bacterium]